MLGFVLGVILSQSVDVVLKEDKNSITLGESILFTAELKNKGNSVAEISLPSFDENGISLETTAGEKTYSYSQYRLDPFVRERKTEASVSLLSGDSTKLHFEFLPPIVGKLTIKAKFKNGKDIVTSNSVTINVKPGKNKDEEQTNLGAILVIETTKDSKPWEESFLVKFNPEDSFNSVANFALTVKSGFYNGLKFFKAVKYGFIQTGCPYDKGYGTAGYLYKRDKTSGEFDLGSIGLCNAPKGDGYSGSQFFITLAALPDFKDKFTKIGDIISKKQLLENEFTNVSTNASNAHYTDIKIKSIRLVTLSDQEIKSAK